MSDDTEEQGVVYRLEAVEYLLEWLISRLGPGDRAVLEAAHKSLERMIAAERTVHGGPPRDEDLKTPNAMRALLGRGLARSADEPPHID